MKSHPLFLEGMEANLPAIKLVQVPKTGLIHSCSSNFIPNLYAEKYHNTSTEAKNFTGYGTADKNRSRASKVHLMVRKMFLEDGWTRKKNTVLSNLQKCPK